MIKDRFASICELLISLHSEKVQTFSKSFQDRRIFYGFNVFGVLGTRVQRKGIGVLGIACTL